MTRTRELWVLALASVADLSGTVIPSTLPKLQAGQAPEEQMRGLKLLARAQLVAFVGLLAGIAGFTWAYLTNLGGVQNLWLACLIIMVASPSAAHLWIRRKART